MKDFEGISRIWINVNRKYTSYFINIFSLVYNYFAMF